MNQQNRYFSETDVVDGEEVVTVGNDSFVLVAERDVLDDIGCSSLMRPGEAVLDMSGVEVFMQLFEGMLYANCSNRRVAHLSRFARKARTRKKNFNRMVKIVAGEATITLQKEEPS